MDIKNGKYVFEIAFYPALLLKKKLICSFLASFIVGFCFNVKQNHYICKVRITKRSYLTNEINEIII